VDSLVGCVAGDESNKELDLEGDPFFELEAWFAPEQSLIRPLESPTEEELANRLRTAPRFLSELVCQGVLTRTDYERVMNENGMLAYQPSVETKETPHGGRTHASYAQQFSIGSAGQLAMMGFHIPDTLA